MGNSCYKTNQKVDVKMSCSSTALRGITPPTSPSSEEGDETRHSDLHACVWAALEHPSQESTVHHLYDAFGGQVDKIILDYLVSTARLEGPGLDDQVEALVSHATSNGVDGSFLSPPQPATNEPRALKLPIIDNMELVENIRMILCLPSNWAVDEICRRIGNYVEHETVALVGSWALEQSSKVEEQAALLAERMQEMGFEGCFEMTEQDKVDCPVCMETLCKQNGFEFQCGLDQAFEGNPHIFCYDCALNFVRAAVDRGDPNLHCFQCQHVVMPHELASILGHGDEHAGRSHPLYQEIDILKRDHAIGKDPAQYAQCPSLNCDWIVARSERGAAEKAECPDCGFCFCTNCLAPYHYRTSCTERRQLHDTWRSWLVSGRVKYWEKDGEMRRKAQAIARTEKARVASILRVERQDEEWKAANCRHCPHCNRLVNRLEGCSIMRCGYDTDTKANVQNGCMKRFDWNSAEPYKAQSIGSRVTIQAAGSGEKTRHEYWQCAVCDQSIVGLRFECVNCVSYTLCEKCERDHWDVHGDGHFFRIHEKADT